MSQLKTKVLGVIPSRYASTRLPGKPLAKLAGKPMVQWVYESAKAALARVVVATDDYRIFETVERFGGEAMMTPKQCATGTDRVAFVATKLKADYYVNVQGDEPLMHPDTIKSAVSLALKKQSVATAALQIPFTSAQPLSQVKVVMDKDGRALYFSRSVIPCQGHGAETPTVFKHLGLYVYPRSVLFQFVKLKPTVLEQTEKLEQLRALYHGIPIYVAITQHDSIGVDTPDDLKYVESKLTGEKNG